MSGEALFTDMDIYHVQGDVVVNVIEMMETMLHFVEMMLGYAKLGRNPIIMSDE